MRIATILAAAIAATSVAGSTLAADLPSRKEAPVYVAPAPIFTWTGIYVGLNAGYAWGDRNLSVASYPTFVNTQGFGNPSLVDFASIGGTAFLNGGSKGGFAGGGQIGYNRQMGSFVVGLEADIQGLWSSNTAVMALSAQPAANSPLYTAITATQRTDWLSTVRGRLGFTVTPTLLAYATGGLAFGGVKADVGMFQSHLTGRGTTASGYMAMPFSDTRIGWTLGGGVEWAFAQNWSAKIEYLHYDLGSARRASGLVSALPDGTIRYSIGSVVSTKFNGDIIRAGLNYRFNWGAAPVVARY